MLSILCGWQSSACFLKFGDASTYDCHKKDRLTETESETTETETEVLVHCQLRAIPYVWLLFIALVSTPA